MAESTKFARAKHEITSYCKHLLETLTLLIQDAAGDGEKEIVLSAYQERCMNICEDFNEQKSRMMSETALCKCLQTIAQLVLDLTFVEESSLIDQEFPTDSSLCSVRNIIETLQSVEDLSNRIEQDQSILDVLSSEIIECLNWRKGALLYMYCHTLTSQFSMEHMPSHFSQCLEDGIKFLISMFCTRSSPKWLTNELLNGKENDSYPEEGEESNMLLTQGILSDTHLLALMYCGEMCYWHTQLKSLPEMSKHLKDPKSDDTKIGASGVTSLESDISRDCSEVKKHKFSDSCDSLQQSEASTRETKVSSSHFLSVTDLFSSAVSISAGNCAGSGKLAVEKTLNIVQIGQLCLENYVNAAIGPMVIGGWKTTRADEILQYFYNLKC